MVTGHAGINFIMTLILSDEFEQNNGLHAYRDEWSQ